MTTARQQREQRRRRITALTTAGVAVVVILVVLLSSCERPEAKPIALVEKLDCSTSMRNAMPRVDRLMYAITADAAAWGSVLSAGAFRGAPSTAPAPWPVTYRYPQRWQHAKDANGADYKSQNLADEWLVLSGQRQAQRVAALADCTSVDPDEPGTPLLSVLAQASSEFDDMASDATDRRIVLYTDGGIIGDGLDARDGITPEQEAQAIAAFKPRLPGLQGVRVWMIGPGSGTTIPAETLDVVHSLFDKVIDAAGGELAGFGPDSHSYPMREG